MATWCMTTWHMATWGHGQIKKGNAHHNGIGEISCSMCLIVASERKFRRSASRNFVQVTSHLPVALRAWS
jgi:hypothetical protein